MRLLKGKRDVVAPISAPMLQIVPIPVQESDSTPGPWYSTMAPVPPLTVKIPATFRITSRSEESVSKEKDRNEEKKKQTLWSSPPANLPGQPHTNDLRALQLPRQV